jgi:hypothetical protein
LGAKDGVDFLLDRGEFGFIVGLPYPPRQAAEPDFNWPPPTDVRRRTS